MLQALEFDIYLLRCKELEYFKRMLPKTVIFVLNMSYVRILRNVLIKYHAEATLSNLGFVNK